MKTLKDFKDDLSRSLYGITTQEAFERGVCIQCEKPALERCYSSDGRREYVISGLCELCFDSITQEPEELEEEESLDQLDEESSLIEPEPVKVEEKPVGLMDDTFYSGHYRMFSGQAEAAKFVYRKVEAKEGGVYLYPVNSDSPGEQVHYHDPRDTQSQGYGGSILHFALEDGTVYAAKGPWHSNTDALFTETGVDLRDTHYTFGCVARERHYDSKDYYRSWYTGLYFADTKPVLGSFDRIKKIAVEICHEGGPSGSVLFPVKRRFLFRFRVPGGNLPQRLVSLDLLRGFLFFPLVKRDEVVRG